MIENVLFIQTLFIYKLFVFICDDYQYTFLQGPNLIINQPDEVLNNMGEWCTQHHGEVR
jgi:oligoribonuclease